jgi:regulator of sigma E protease
MLYTLIAFAVALGLIVTFHELGHYWVARQCGVKILRFSVGFGKVLLRRVDRHGTEWALSAIPLGGYVKMLDNPSPGSSPQEAGRAFNRQGVGKRFAVVLAGPMANFVLAALLYALLGVVGTQEPAAVIAAPASQTAAAIAGLQAGERITDVNGAAVHSWTEARWSLLDALTSGGKVPITAQTPQGASRQYTLVLPEMPPDPNGADPMARAGLALAPPRPRITDVIPGGAGARAGLAVGDVITVVDGQRNPDAGALVKDIQGHAGQPVNLTVLRDGVVITLVVTPQVETVGGAQIGRIGVMLGGDLPMVTVRYGLFESLGRGVSRTFETAWLSLKMMGRMVTGSVSVRNISGPVTIADYAGRTARIGLAAYIGFLALISVSIGVLNLLPIPMLDGGHLMYYVLEIVRGKPVPEQWLETGQRVGLGLLAALMGLAFFNDFSHLFS